MIDNPIERAETAIDILAFMQKYKILDELIDVFSSEEKDKLKATQLACDTFVNIMKLCLDTCDSKSSAIKLLKVKTHKALPQIKDLCALGVQIGNEPISVTLHNAILSELDAYKEINKTIKGLGFDR